MADKILIIKRIKEAYNLRTNVEVARFLGVSAQVLSNWQNRNTVNFDTILPKCADINLNWLINGVGEPFLKGFKPAIASEDNADFKHNGKARRTKSVCKADRDPGAEELLKENAALNEEIKELKKHTTNLRKAVNQLRKELGKAPVDFVRDRDWEKTNVKTKKR